MYEYEEMIREYNLEHENDTLPETDDHDKLKAENRFMFDYLCVQAAKERLTEDKQSLAAYGDSVLKLETLQLENCTQESSYESLSMGGNEDMSKQNMRICIDHNEDGTPVYKQIFAHSQAELADKACLELLSSKRGAELIQRALQSTNGNDVASLLNVDASIKENKRDTPTLREYAPHYLERKEKQLKPTALKGIQSYLSKHILPALGDKRLDEIGFKDIQNLLDSKSELSEQMNKHLKNTLSNIFEIAIAEELIEKNPTKNKLLVVGGKEPVERKPVPQETEKAIIANLDRFEPNDRLVLLFFMLMGLRRGECIGLKWEDIDWSTDTVYIHDNVTFTGNKPSVGTTKNKSGTAYIPLASNHRAILEPMKATGYIITSKHDKSGEKPISETTWKRTYERIQRKCDSLGIDLKEYTPHCFRHSFATGLVDNGANFKTTGAALRDRDPKTYEQRYTHAVDSSVRNAMEAYTNSLFNNV